MRTLKQSEIDYLDCWGIAGVKKNRDESLLFARQLRGNVTGRFYPEAVAHARYWHSLFMAATYPVSSQERV